MLKLKYLFVVLVLIVVSCGQKKSSNDQPAASAPTTAPTQNSPTPTPQPNPETPVTPPVDTSLSDFTKRIQGQWATACKKITKDGTFETNIIKIENTNITILNTSYKDTACSTAKYTARLTGTFAIKNAATIKTGGYNVSYKLDNAYVTLYDGSLVWQSRISSQCGASDWASGVEKKIPIVASPSCRAATSVAPLTAAAHNSVIVQQDTTMSLFDLDSSTVASYVAQKK